jgi:RND family efflux transporter MFP subunit
MLKKDFIVSIASVFLYSAICFYPQTVIAKNTHKKNIVKVEINILKLVKIGKKILTYGNIIAPKSVILKAQSDGVIEAINFKGGQRVHKGDLLFIIKSNDVSTPLNTLKASLAIAKERALRSEALYKNFKGGISEIDLLDAKLKYQQVQAQFDEASSIHYVRSAVNGVISATNLATGDMVKSGERLVKISNQSRLQIEYQLPIDQVEQAKVGQLVKFITDTQTVIATVSYISPEASDYGNLVTLRANIKDKSRLRPNTFGQIIEVVNPDYQAIAIDQNLIEVDSNGFYVYLLKNNVITKKYIEIGDLTNQGLILVGKGLHLGDQLITTPSEQFSVGEKAEVLKS